MRFRILAALCLALTGCSERARVSVHASMTPRVPRTDLPVTAVPFDADQMLDSLGRLSMVPRPDFSTLEARLRGYRPDAPPADSAGASVTADWQATRDSVTRLSRELSRQDRKAPGYREAYLRFRQLYGRYTTKEAEREARARGLRSNDRSIAEEAMHA